MLFPGGEKGLPDKRVGLKKNKIQRSETQVQHFTGALFPPNVVILLLWVIGEWPFEWSARASKVLRLCRAATLARFRDESAASFFSFLVATYSTSDACSLAATLDGHNELQPS